MAAFPKGRINRAKALTFLRFQPQEGALTALLADLAQQRKQQLSAAHGGASAMLATLSGVRPQLEGIYSQAGQEHQTAQNESQTALQGLSGPVVDAIRAATARENAGYGNRLATAKASGLSEIGQRQTSTRAGEIAASSQANKVYGTEASKVFDQLASLAAQKGAFINTTLADLTDAARKQAIAKSNLGISKQRVGLEKQGVQLRSDTLAETKRSHQTNEGIAQARQRTTDWKAHHPNKSGKAPRFGPGSLTQTGESKVIDRIHEGVDWVHQLRASGNSDHQIYAWLRTGAKLGPDKNKKTLTIPKIGHDETNIAFDIVAHGHLSPPNIKAAHQLGIHVPPHWRPPAKKK